MAVVGEGVPADGQEGRVRGVARVWGRLGRGRQRRLAELGDLLPAHRLDLQHLLVAVPVLEGRGREARRPDQPEALKLHNEFLLAEVAKERANSVSLDAELQGLLRAVEVDPFAASVARPLGEVE